VEEKHIEGEPPFEFVIRISRKKAFSVSSKLNGDYIVIGADTIVVIDKVILGKPRNEVEAKSMLLSLSGREHQVITGISIVKPKKEILHNECVESKVKFKSLAPLEVEGYIKTLEPMDKAGGYGAQGIGAFMIEEIQGSYTNVIGLPLSQLTDAFTKLEILKPFAKDGSNSKSKNYTEEN